MSSMPVKPRRATPPHRHPRNLRVLWVNDLPAPQGGAESYVTRTAGLLAQRGVESYLLYDPSHPGDPNFLKPFRGAFPMVDVARQVEELEPDLIYVHRCRDDDRLEELNQTGRPVLRFFHDHRLFCLREHKYSPILHATCTRRTGLACYTCPGFLVRGESRRVSLRTLGSLVSSQKANLGLAGWVVASSYMAEHVARHGFDPDRIHTIPLFTQGPESPRLTSPCEGGDEALAPEGPEPDLLLFVGQLIRGKGLDVLLKAVSRCSSAPRLVIAGEGHQEALFRKLARSLHLEDQVEFVGRQTREQLAGWYSRCTALVVPSRAPETFGLTGIEAMSHGVPVIAARVGGTGEWLEDGVTGLGFRSGDPMDLARAIDEMLRDVGSARAMGAAGLRLHRDRFLPEHHVDRLVDLFYEVSGREPARQEGAA